MGAELRLRAPCCGAEGFVLLCVIFRYFCILLKHVLTINDSDIQKCEVLPGRVLFLHLMLRFGSRLYTWSFLETILRFLQCQRGHERTIGRDATMTTLLVHCNLLYSFLFSVNFLPKKQPKGLFTKGAEGCTPEENERISASGSHKFLCTNQ